MGNSHEWFLGKIEGEFADMIWANATVSSSQLVQLAKEKFDWKRTTTHTVIRRLCDKGLVHAYISEKNLWNGNKKKILEY